MSSDPPRDANDLRGHIPSDDVLAGIAEVARLHLGWTGPVEESMPLVETFELDSLRQLTLVIELENRFRVKLDEEDEELLVTVGDVANLIRRKRERG